MSIIVIGRDDVRDHLTYPLCIDIVRGAMIALSQGGVIQPMRQVVRMDQGRMLGIMPGAMGGSSSFGAKIVSLFPDNSSRGLSSHQGAIMLFDPRTGALAALVHGGETTRIRTGAASAAATDVLARKDARRLAILGYGEQAESHAHAIAQVRALSTIAIWGRDGERARRFARRTEAALGIACSVEPSVRDAVRDADIICTVTAAAEPILLGKDVKPGTHLNVVGSNFAGPREIDSDLVARARFFPDQRQHVLQQGAEFVHAREAGLVSDEHVLPEIGEVFAGSALGRTDDAQITIYKSLGHVAQDLSCALYLQSDAQQRGYGTTLDF